MSGARQGKLPTGGANGGRNCGDVSASSLCWPLYEAAGARDAHHRVRLPFGPAHRLSLSLTLASLPSNIYSFLGAGKSTLVSHVLHAQHGWRIAVVVNELGQGLSVGLERTLVQDSAG
jgi:hypothetical protein